MSDPTQPQGTAGDHATKPAAIDTTAITLVGIMSTQAGPTALFRSGTGTNARAAPGERVFGLDITAIGDDQVIVTNRWGQSLSLALPNG